MRKIVVTSKNPVKKKVVEKVLAYLCQNEMFEYVVLALENEGREPMGREEILAQMQTALVKARHEVKNADYYVCMEGGMVDDDKIMNETAYVVIQNSEGVSATSSCASFPVPTAIASDVRNGKDFAQAVDEFFKTNGTKQGGGFVKILTNGLVSKEDHYFQPTAIAFSTLFHSDWFK